MRIKVRFFLHSVEQDTNQAMLDVCIIDNKSVSRKHLVIHIGPVNPGDGVCNALRFVYSLY